MLTHALAPHPPSSHPSSHTATCMHVATTHAHACEHGGVRPRRLRHVHRYHKHAHTHRHTHTAHGSDSARAPSACAHSALWWPALAWRLDVSWSLYRALGTSGTSSSPPPPSRASCPQFLHSSQSAFQNTAGQAQTLPRLTQRRASPGSPQSSHSQPQLSSLNISLQRLFPQLGMPFPAFST